MNQTKGKCCKNCNLWIGKPLNDWLCTDKYCKCHSPKVLNQQNKNSKGQEGERKISNINSNSSPSSLNVTMTQNYLDTYYIKKSIVERDYVKKEVFDKWNTEQINILKNLGWIKKQKVIDNLEIMREQCNKLPVVAGRLLCNKYIDTIEKELNQR